MQMSKTRDPRTLLWAAAAASWVGLLGSNSLPLLVGAVIDGIGFDTRQAGLLGSVEIGAMALASLLLAPRVGSISRRGVALVSAAVLAGAQLLSALPESLAWLVMLRVVAGLGEGCVFATANAVIASSVDPDRLYARVTVLGALAAAGLFVGLPYAIELWSQRGAFAALGGAALLCVPLLVLLPRSVPAGMHSEILGGSVPRGPALAVLASALVLSVGEGAIWTFVERIGSHVGLGIDAIGRVLAATTVAGISGAALAAWAGTRFGRTLPLTLGMSMICVAGVILGHATGPVAYVGAELLYNTAYLFVLPFLLGTAAAIDTQGRVAAATGGVVLLGYGLGPGIGGVLVAWGSFPPLAWFLVVCCATAILVILPLTLALDRVGRGTCAEDRAATETPR